MQGIVKWFATAKGYGFIQPQDGSKDVFVHQTQIKMSGFRQLQEGQKVEFDLVKGTKGPEAQNVTVVG